MPCRAPNPDRERTALLEVERVARMAVQYDGQGHGVARKGGPLNVVLMRLDEERRVRD